MSLRNILFLFPVIILSFIFYSCKDNTTNNMEPSSKMTQVSKYNTSGYAHDVYVYQQGVNYAFVADDNAGLQIINVSNLSIPIFTASYNTTGTAVNVKVASINSKLYAFVADGAAGLNIIDVTQPQTPVLDTIISFGNDNVICSFIETSTRRAYIGTYNNMYIYDLSNLPNSITQLSAYGVIDNLNSIWVDNGVAYLAENTAGLELVNVTNPAFPLYLSAFNSPGYAMDVKLSGHYAYIADWTSIQVLDVVNAFTPLSVGSYYNENSQFNSLAPNATSGILFSGDGPFGVETIGIGSPSSPQQLGYYNTPDYAGGVAALSNYVFAADGNDGLLIFTYTTK